MEKTEHRLFKLHQKFTDNKDSKGIGLYLVKSYMNSLGGDIEVRSKNGVGTAFILNFKD
ncbi:ATP-binding protein [Salegentibacter sp. Hel_I_6]|uniref:ATP-binding protein n=1 Tax=Salegentibacter sp. Hel_I_6 TaxID=1250278 RepID=UPI001E543251|nr:ATP-binding protein [Salegentibacter sp. Hel_I_6]